MKKLWCSLFLVLPLIHTWPQQNQQIKGRVIDSQQHYPLKDVAISILSTSESEYTAADGYFIFNQVSSGAMILVLTLSGYVSKRFPIDLPIGKTIDLGVITLNKDMSDDVYINSIPINDGDFVDEDIVQENTSLFLRPSRDAFQRVAAFNWAPMRFKNRGLDNKYHKMLINGIAINKIIDGRPLRGNWSGLHEVIKHPELAIGITPTARDFGGIAGTTQINIRASEQRRGNRITHAMNNTTYQWRSAITYSSGLLQNNWAYTLSTSYSGANTAYFEGTPSRIQSVFIAVEKKLNPRHALNFNGIYASNTRALNSALTDEITALKGHRYNPNWGWQGSGKRHSRQTVVKEPLFMLSHYWSINSKTNLLSTISYQFGHIARSRLGHLGANNPMPTYYKNLPSFYANYHDIQGVFQGNQEPYSTLATTYKEHFTNNSQINWDEIYHNNLVNGRSRIILYADRTDDQSLSFNSNLNAKISERYHFSSTVNYRRLHSDNFSVLTDLLGGDGYLDINPFYKNSQSQTDLHRPNRIIEKGDRFGYHYKLQAQIVELFNQIQFQRSELTAYFANELSYTYYQRTGFYKNGLYPDHSYGKSAPVNFSNYRFKTGASYLFSSSHLTDFNLAYSNQAPTLRNSFAHVRSNNHLISDLNSETTFSIDASYTYKTSKLNFRATVYLTQINHAVELSSFYSQGLDLVYEDENTLNHAFLTQIINGINKRNLGFEMGFEYQISRKITGILAAASAQTFYTNHPQIELHVDQLGTSFNYGTAYLKNYRVAAGPQTAISWGLDYRNPKQWSAGINANYFDHNHVQIAPLRRTDPFVIDPMSANRAPYQNISEEELTQGLKQERLKSLIIVNLKVAKSWKINRKTFGFFSSIHNVLDRIYKVAGQEQNRTANYKQQFSSHSGTAHPFANQYFYGFGRQYQLSFYYHF